MKPRITLASSWYDCGYRYEWWKCEGQGWVGCGPTKELAYSYWIEAVGAV